MSTVGGPKGLGNLGKLGKAGEVGRIGEAATNVKGLVRLYRAVSKDELNDVVKSGRLQPGRGSLEGKWFAESAEDAQRWGQALGGENSIIGVDVPQEVADSLFRIEKLDNIGPARFADLGQLNSITGWEVLP